MKNAYLLICLLLGACTSSTETTQTMQSETINKGVYFKRSDLGQEWPFKTIQEGEVKCIDGHVVLMAKSGGIWALNGTARSVAEERSWRKLDGEQIVGKSIDPMLQAGLKLCQ